MEQKYGIGDWVRIVAITFDYNELIADAEAPEKLLLAFELNEEEYDVDIDRIGEVCQVVQINDELYYPIVVKFSDGYRTEVHEVELEPADAPAPEAGEPEALRVNPLTDAGVLLSVNLKLRAELNAEKEKRMDSEAGAYNLYTELCDVKEENRSHLRRLDSELDTLRAELARVKAELDAARDASKAWKAAAKKRSMVVRIDDERKAAKALYNLLVDSDILTDLITYRRDPEYAEDMGVIAAFEAAFIERTRWKVARDMNDNGDQS